MYKNIKVILIGGSPMSGKSVLASRLSALYGYSHISTDDIGEILQVAFDINPMKGFDYREYYIQKPFEELVNEAYEYHEKIFPAIERLISIHSSWGSPIIIEGWALYPDMLKNIANENMKKIWLICEEKVLQARLDESTPFYSGASDEETMISKVFDGCLKGLGLLSPAMNLCNVAQGRIDAFIDFGCSMEGQAAGGYILQKAGGKLLNYDKSSWNHCETGIIATNTCLKIL